MQCEVKKFLRDPDRGRPRQQIFLSVNNGHGQPTEEELEGGVRDYIELERRSDLPLRNHDLRAAEVGCTSGTESEKSVVAERLVDVVLSDMSAPWEQTAGFWKRSLSNPYFRMMNTSGMSFRDHAGSMVRITPDFCCVVNSVNPEVGKKDLCSAALRFSFDTLRSGGHLVCKFYQGGEDKAMETRLKSLFAKVHREKPESSRSVRR